MSSELQVLREHVEHLFGYFGYFRYMLPQLVWQLPNNIPPDRHSATSVTKKPPYFYEGLDRLSPIDFLKSIFYTNSTKSLKISCSI
jgi:hypothetical protein